MPGLHRVAGIECHTDRERDTHIMRKFILGLAATAAIATPLAIAGTASAAPAQAEKATGTVAWDFNDGQVTGTGMWLHGIVTAGSYQKIDAQTAVFGGEITSGSFDYTEAHAGTDYFTVKVVDGGTSGRNGDIIAVLANMDGHGNWLTSPDATTTRDYPMTPATAGIVTSGNLTGQ